MGFSKLKIPKVCEFCGKPFEAKTMVTRFCSTSCINKAGKERKRKEQKDEHKQTLLELSATKIAQAQTRPFISVTEATVLFGISKNTVHRLIKAGKIPAYNFGQRLTRVSRKDLEAIFTAVELPKEPTNKPIKMQYTKKECYTINEVSEKFGVSSSTVSKVIRRNSIPKIQEGKYVYVPKELIDNVFSKQ